MSIFPDFLSITANALCTSFSICCILLLALRRLRAGWWSVDARFGLGAGLRNSSRCCSMARFFSRALDRVFAAGADGGTGTGIRFLRFLSVRGVGGVVCILGAG